MKQHKNVYRKNFSLIIAFLVMISVTLIVALVVSYNLTSTYVESEFASKKIDVLEETVKPYNDFFLNKIPEITSYQGYLTNASASNYASSVFNNYPFVRRIVFYDISIGSKTSKSKQGNKLSIAIQSVYQYHRHHRGITGSLNSIHMDDEDFRDMANKLNDYIAFSDTSRGSTPDEIFRTFYDVKPEKISYLNILRREDVKIYRDLQNNVQPGVSYKQNMMTFLLDPYSLKVKNIHKELYQSIAIKPVVYYPLDNDATDKRTTEVALPGAFSDYKLFFRSNEGYLTAETNRRFMPIAGIVLLIYIFLVLIGYLIYRNLKINLRLFKLQYDFINNFTHEFKTPVSVIKIAGSNLRGDGMLSERQLKHYGKILDEEADKLNELMNKLLSFTQLENKSINIKKEEIDLNDMVKGCIDSFSMKYPDFKLQYKITDVKTIYADPVLLGSVFTNLIENAYKYSHPQKKELFIKITGDKRNNIVFSFIDKGIGIPKSELNNIFNKFYRIENQYNQNGSVGLGLAFCKELVNFMNGEITVNSQVDVGSEFVVTLPYDN
jgi:two-component system, OmpR family, phosphate regulon sensor histidine kinase PhoR